MTELPVIVIGAGPVGLAAAGHLVRAGSPVQVLEAGSSVGTHVAEWRHVRLFSPWHEVLDPVSVELLETHGWSRPPQDALPSGDEFLSEYLLPLAGLPEIAAVIEADTRVTAIGREGIDKTRTADRHDVPFVVTALGPNGERRFRARAVIDASGTWGQPNPLGSSGVPAEGELAAEEQIVRGIPDVLGVDRARFAGRRVAVVGSGHSAQNVVRDLAALVAAEPETTAEWIIRSSEPPQVTDGAALPARADLVRGALDVVADGPVTITTGLAVASVVADGEQISLVGHDGTEAGPFDLVVACTGARPDLDLARELRLGIDPITEAPVGLSALIDPNIHTCGTVPLHGAAELRHPDVGFFVVGNKSYGRAPTFLLRTGYEQVRSVVAELSRGLIAA